MISVAKLVVILIQSVMDKIFYNWEICQLLDYLCDSPDTSDGAEEVIEDYVTQIQK